MWANKNNKASFIELTDVGRLNQEEHTNLSAFDVKTKTSAYRVYNEIDWTTLDAKLNRFRLKFDKNQLRVNQHHFNKLKTILNDVAALYMTISRRQMKDIIIEVPAQVLKTLHIKLIGQIRILSIKIKFKTGICVSRVHQYINDVIFQERFHELNQQLDFRRKFTDQLLFDKQVHDVQEALNLVTSFQQHKAHCMTSRKGGNESINKLLFKFPESGSLCKIMFDPDFDY